MQFKIRELHTAAFMNFWLTGFFAWSIVVSIAALSFLLGWHYAVGFCLIVTLVGGILFGRFIHPLSHQQRQSARKQNGLNQQYFSQTELLQLSDWIAKAGDQLKEAAEILEVYIRQQQRDTLLLTKLAEVFEAAQLIIQEVQTLMKQGNQQARRVGIELYYRLEKSVTEIDLTEAIRLHTLKRRGK